MYTPGLSPPEIKECFDIILVHSINVVKELNLSLIAASLSNSQVVMSDVNNVKLSDSLNL
ncbi:hypothetical protein J6590_074449 [Homalodisca vitripennis]|nr:hypothetical protein J6590_074449 [Homalodisca vitripennis]